MFQNMWQLLELHFVSAFLVIRHFHNGCFGHQRLLFNCPKNRYNLKWNNTRPTFRFTTLTNKLNFYLTPLLTNFSSSPNNYFLAFTSIAPQLLIIQTHCHYTTITQQNALKTTTKTTQKLQQHQQEQQACSRFDCTRATSSFVLHPGPALLAVRCQLFAGNRQQEAAGAAKTICRACRRNWEARKHLQIQMNQSQKEVNCFKSNLKKVWLIWNLKRQ